jgi:hypothetical protein
MKRKRTQRETSQFVEWARRATRALDDSSVMLGVWDHDHKGTGPRFEFELQIGHCLCEGKPIVLVCEEGQSVPPKLARIAEAIEYYAPGHEEGMKDAVRRALMKVDKGLLQ